MRRDGLNGGVAAFFDLDGTLIAEPSLEKRFFAHLRRRNAIPVGNYFLWLARAVRLAPRGIQMIRHANKMYLRDVLTDERGYGREAGRFPRRDSGQAEMAVPRFLPAAMNQVAWHARQGHGIVLVSGTLAPLADEVALALVVRLAVRGVAASVGACATRLQENGGKWTGQIVGEAIFGEAKARAARRIAEERGFDLSRCYAYGNCISDRWMLEAVGRPAAVNPSQDLTGLARRRGWTVLTWREERDSRQRAQRTQRTSEAERLA
jgi:HAD superfamily hydrolase (TIGR01490 family)